MKPVEALAWSFFGSGIFASLSQASVRSNEAGRSLPQTLSLFVSGVRVAAGVGVDVGAGVAVGASVTACACGAGNKAPALASAKTGSRASVSPFCGSAGLAWTDERLLMIRNA